MELRGTVMAPPLAPMPIPWQHHGNAIPMLWESLPLMGARGLSRIFMGVYDEFTGSVTGFDGFSAVKWRPRR